MTKKAEFVPISQVGNRTERIQVANLGLPVGFDDDALEMNVGKLEKIATWANLGSVLIMGYSGNVTQESIGIGGVNESGTATATKSLSATRAKIYDASVQSENQELPFGYHWRNAVLKINNNEIEEHIRKDGDKWKRGVFDISARAKYMNLALRKSLIKSASDTAFPFGIKRELIGFAALSTLSWAMFTYLWQEGPERGVVYTLGYMPVAGVLNHGLARYRYGKDLPPRQWSAFPKPPFDRFAMATLLAKTGKLIRPAKTTPE